MPHVGQKRLVIEVVALLVGVDENEIERLLRTEAGQQFARVAEPQFDPVLHAGPDPVTPGDARPLEFLVEADQFAAGKQPARDADRAAAGERADFHCPFRADERDQQGHQAALIGADRHVRDFAEVLRLLAQRLEDRIVRVRALRQRCSRRARPSGECIGRHDQDRL